MDKKRYSFLDVNGDVGHRRATGDGKTDENKAGRWATVSGIGTDHASVPRSPFTSTNTLLFGRTRALTGAANYRQSPVGLFDKDTTSSDPTTYSDPTKYSDPTTYSESTSYRKTNVPDLDTERVRIGHSGISTIRDTSLCQHGESLTGAEGYSRSPASLQDKETAKLYLGDEFSLLDNDSLYSWSKIEDSNLLFYQGKIPCKPYNVTIDEIHQKWYHDKDQLEFCHGYMQWLFPISESGGLNLYTQALQPHEAEGICNDEQAMTRFRKSYEMMLHFYGMQIVDNNTGELERANNWKERFQNLSTFSHNYMRITRILMSLGELGLEMYKIELVKFLLKEAIGTGELRRTLPSCENYWIATVQDETDRVLLMQYAVDLADGDARKRRQEELESAGAEVKGTEQRSSSVRDTQQRLFSVKDTENRSTSVKDIERISASVRDPEKRTKDKDQPRTSSKSDEEDDHSQAEARTDRHRALMSHKSYKTTAEKTESQHTSTHLERLSTKLASIALNLSQLIGERANQTTVKPKQTRNLRILTEEVSFVWAEMSQISIAEDQKLQDQERMLSAHSGELFQSQARRSPEPEGSEPTRALNGLTKPERSRPTTPGEENLWEDEPTSLTADRDRSTTIKQSSSLTAKEKSLPKDWIGNSTTKMTFTTKLNNATKSYNDSDLLETEPERHQRTTNSHTGESSTSQHNHSSERDQTRRAIEPSRTEDQHRLQHHKNRSLASPTQGAAERAHLQERAKEMHEEDDTSGTDFMETPTTATRTKNTTAEKSALSTSDQIKHSESVTHVHKPWTVTSGSSHTSSVDQPPGTSGQRRDRAHTVAGLPDRPHTLSSATMTASLNHHNSLR